MVRAVLIAGMTLGFKDTKETEDEEPEGRKGVVKEEARVLCSVMWMAHPRWQCGHVRPGCRSRRPVRSLSPGTPASEERSSAAGKGRARHSPPSQPALPCMGIGSHQNTARTWQTYSVAVLYPAESNPGQPEGEALPQQGSLVCGHRRQPQRPSNTCSASGSTALGQENHVLS
jgi:hypothetical protein